MLTRKQHELLMFIHERIKETGVSPSFDEMKEALDLASKSGIHRLITALEERGFIRRLPNRARAIEVIKLPDSVGHGIGSSRSRGFTPSVIEGDLGRVGLGLAVAQGFVAAMGGELSADETPGGGLTMRFSLPHHQEPVTTPKAQGSAP